MGEDDFWSSIIPYSFHEHQVHDMISQIHKKVKSWKLYILYLNCPYKTYFTPICPWLKLIASGMTIQFVKLSDSDERWKNAILDWKLIRCCKSFKFSMLLSLYNGKIFPFWSIKWKITNYNLTIRRIQRQTMTKSYGLINTVHYSAR